MLLNALLGSTTESQHCTGPATTVQDAPGTFQKVAPSCWDFGVAPARRPPRLGNSPITGSNNKRPAGLEAQGAQSRPCLSPRLQLAMCLISILWATVALDKLSFLNRCPCARHWLTASPAQDGKAPGSRCSCCWGARGNAAFQPEMQILFIYQDKDPGHHFIC